MPRQTSPLSRPWLLLLASGALAWGPMNALGQTSTIDMPRSISDHTNSIEVFTTAGEPVSRVPDGVAVIELDGPARLDGEISQGLPQDQTAAKAEMQQRMQSPEWEQVAARYGDLHMGVARAWLLRVEKVPAVVVDGEYVVYGQPDVTAAVMEILEQREGAL
ncbi:TIGR03757 family integrating conjugative element protein [Vreelandella olivaria]|uniref:TIGR03757 family integrating conjugative element protein n=1 Tax=Vreelandella olivaria TaxID=390919 RepID=UPI00201F7E00|nr:TIGR03757 family integrating conjugative element protein [Halomonas olivaria]